MKGVVTRPMYIWDERRYIEISSVRLKVPFRYGRVMCRVEGIKTVQELVKGDGVEFTYKITNWDGIEYFVLESIKVE
jgi:uncharacterized protein YunC (DUF1805 family)